MTDLPIDVCKARNVQREPLKRVPEEAIDKMYARFATQKIPTGITVLRPDELDRIWMHPIDLSQYKKIHHIGDIMLERIQRIATREPKSIVSANSTTGAYFILKILLMRQVLRDRAISKHIHLLYSTTSGFALSIRRNG